MPHLASPSRRKAIQFLAGAAAFPAVATTLPVRAAARQPVQVLTSYPDEVVSRMEAAFEKAWPAYRMQVVWRMPHDALPYLKAPNQSGVDVYWSASPRTFAAAKAAGVWRKLDIDRQGLPTHIGQTALADPDGYYTATEVAGYGFAVNATELAKLQLTTPQDWRDLTDARYAGRIALPIPARVGFAPPMIEIVLQAHGWDAGWALWSELAGNARLVDRGATFVTDEVGTGRCAVGLSIDFFVASAVANAGPGSALQFAYPRHNGVNPGQIALTAQSANRQGGRAFAQFVLSQAGQSILGHPDLKKLPARPSVYASLPPGTHNPFEAAKHGDYDFDGVRAQPRLALSAALFQQMLMEDHTQRVALWQRLHHMEAVGHTSHPRALAARQALSTPPLSEAEANDPALQRLFRERLEGTDRQALLPQETVWRAHSQAQLTQAEAALQGWAA